ncbi:MAG: glycosyltransferase family 2 protein [Acidimicrobiales bacterium]
MSDVDDSHERRWTLTPDVSVVVPTRNGARRVAALLAGLERDEADTFEVIVADDGSEPNERHALRAVVAAHPAVVLIDQPHAGLAAARNAGARAARGKAVLFLDDDMVPPATILHEAAARVSRGADVVLFEIELAATAEPSLLTREVRSWQRDERAALVAGRTRYDDLNMAATAVRRTLFDALGGFDERFTAGGRYGNEDVELGHRLLQHGARVQFASEPVVLTSGAPRPERELDRARDVGRNDVLLVRTHPELAADVFARKLRDATLHRLAALLTFRLRLHGLWRALARPVAARLAARDTRGRVPYSLWYVTRSIEYWIGAREEGATYRHGVVHIS